MFYFIFAVSAICREKLLDFIKVESDSPTHSPALPGPGPTPGARR